MKSSVVGAGAVRLRLVNFELLRILAMLGVLMNHFFNCGLEIYELGTDGFSVPMVNMTGVLSWGVLELMKLVALVSVNCYVLMTGYFQIGRTEWRWRGMLRTWWQMWFYSVVLYLVLAPTVGDGITRDGLFTSLTPLLHNSWWFVTSYLALQLVAPLLSRLVGRLSGRGYLVLLAVGLLLVFQYPLGRLWVGSQQIPLFVYLFLVGGYIRRHLPESQPRTPWLVASVVGLLMLMLGYCIGKNLYLGHLRFLIYAMEYHGAVLPLSVGVFLLFRRLRVPQRMHAPILWLAPLSLATYLIHEHSCVRDIVWGVAAQTYPQLPLWLLPIFAIACCVAIYAICSAIDALLRQLNIF